MERLTNRFTSHPLSSIVPRRLQAARSLSGQFDQAMAAENARIN
jgi:hypothetical protein